MYQLITNNMHPEDVEKCSYTDATGGEEKPNYPLLVLQKSLAGFFLVEILQISLTKRQHCVDVSLVLHRQLQGPEITTN